MSLPPFADMFRFGRGADDADVADGTVSIIGPRDRAMFVLMLDVASGEALPAVKKLMARFPRHRVVFVHTKLDFRPFIEAHAIFERLPSLDEIARFADLLDWPTYLADRQALLFAKWRPDRVIRYGPDLEEYAARVAAVCAGARNAS